MQETVYSQIKPLIPLPLTVQVWEIGTMTSAASEDDEFDKGFIQALIQSNTPSFVRDEDGNLVRTAGSIPKVGGLGFRV